MKPDPIGVMFALGIAMLAIFWLPLGIIFYRLLVG